MGAFFRWFNRAFGRATDGYVDACRHLIHKAGFAFLMLLLLTAGAAFFGKKVPSGFLPDEDQGYVFGGLQLPDASSLQRTSDASREVEQVILKTPGVKYVSSVVGYSMLSGVSTTYSAFFFVSFKSWDERASDPAESYDAIKRHLSDALSRVTSGIAFIFPPPAIPGVGASGGFTFVLEDRSGPVPRVPGQQCAGFPGSSPQAARVRRRDDALRSSEFPRSESMWTRPRCLPNRWPWRACTRHCRPSWAARWSTTSTVSAGSGRSTCKPRAPIEPRRRNLGKFYVTNSSGQMVPLSTLTDTRSTSGAEFIMKYNLFQAVQINGSAAPGYSSTQAIAALEDVFHKTMPPQMGFDYMGMSYQEVKAAQGVSPMVIFGLSFLIVFLIMAAQYESWTLPFSVLLGVPIAVFGAFLAVYLRRLDNNVYAQIGLVMLIGLSAKNAILIVEFAKAEYETGKSLLDASLAGARLRLRPILMTAFAFILGCVPLWRASGAGAVSRQVLGTIVIGGMLAASLIAIFFIPVSFDVVERFGGLFEKKKPA